MFTEEAIHQEIKQIYEEYYKEVYQFLLYFTGDRNNAEDLTQEVFLRVMDALPRFEQRSSLKTYILRIAKRVVYDDYRKKKVKTIFAGKWLMFFHSEEGLPEEELQAKEDKKNVEKALQQIKPKYRTIIFLRGVKGYSIKETAEVIGCSEAKVKVDYHRAKKELRMKWEAVAGKESYINAFK
ncbi:RNA polymerase sigma factor [Brevibacillus daliensis]|uniref:RNA polymerase sigma factor n=1 Tax=Brevibacillus daliensis TaxID=2892995 RepID=UPI001E35203A|nr:RNA polymerase sigma factor [Brevibacillus daliensis]